ncbi:MAG: hypothetical protein WC663_00165 [Patescibacteria group bacterium]|jgi:hypothetical protein
MCGGSCDYSDCPYDHCDSHPSHSQKSKQNDASTEKRIFVAMLGVYLTESEYETYRKNVNKTIAHWR